MYFPLSQITPNLYTNGGEYVLSTTREEYVGYYYQVFNGSRYTGKNPQDGPNILLVLPKLVQNFSSVALEGENNLDGNIYTIDESPSKSLPTRLLPQFNPTLPTTPDKNLGVFSRYFCKKNNELIYLEIDKQTFTDLSSRSPKIAWDLYTPLTTVWYIKGNKETTYKANKGLISVIEQRQKWYGFSKYLKEDYLKYYVGE
jgi:hypothetical protein